MTRTQFQTTSHLDAEMHLMDLVAKRWKCQAIKLNETKFNIDFLCLRTQQDHGVVNGDQRIIPKDKGTALVECRCRNNRKDAFPTMMLSMNKWACMHKYAAAGICTVFLVEWTDQIGYLKIDSDPSMHIEWGGRSPTNMRDGMDIEPMVHVPVSEFVVL